ncbi:MAG: hypothetical protein APF76_00465 [Desulfitibacter sp. BRH_c19]|nr:MAG: hypothetical protein APF76_00465 [Desulfitibacter sp. BRH_c19]
MIFVLAGTSEAKETIKLLRDRSFQVSASVVSNYGYELLANNGVKHLKQGSFNKEELIKCLKEMNTLYLVDATHPFAKQISALAMEVAAELKINYIRLERQSCELPDNPLIKKVTTLEEIEKYLFKGQKVFSTLGSNNLAEIVSLVKRVGANLTARVLPVSKSIKACEDLGLKPENIIALKGPFSKELNTILFKQFGAQLILTKESGNIGGFSEKIAAAIELSIPVVVLCRPVLNYPLLVNSPQEVLEYIEQALEN